MGRKAMELPYTLKIDRWETPATKYPLTKVGVAEISRRRQGRGVYRMEGVCGYAFYQVTNPIEVTNLKIGGQVVMLDDPLHWLGMKELAKHSKGKVLVGGLGLGLIVHALIENEVVTDIDVVEINPDVIKLITPLLPLSEKLHIENYDVMAVSPEKDYNTVILDLWVKAEKEPGTTIFNQMVIAFATFKRLYPTANVFIWGIGDASINPSIDPEVRKLIPKDYWRG